MELSSEELWRAADEVRVLVESAPDALAEVRGVLAAVEDELWAEADDVWERPNRWSNIGATWGARALHGLRSCIPS